MTHFIVDDNFPDHPKFIGISDAALACWTKGMAYCSRLLTDGIIEARVLPIIGKPKAAAELVERGLWETTATGWIVHDYAHRQRTRAEVESLVDERSKSGTIGNHKRWHVERGVSSPTCKFCFPTIANSSQTDRNSDGIAIANRSQTDRKSSPDTDTETDTETETDISVVSKLKLVGDQARRDPRVVSALKLIGEEDTRSRIDFAEDDEDVEPVLSFSAYSRECSKQRDEQMGDVLDRVAQEHPEYDVRTLASEAMGAAFLGGVA